MFDLFDINTSSLTAHKMLLSTVANNIANINSTGKINGEVYKRQGVIFSEFNDALKGEMGVKAQKVDENRNDRLVYDKDNPLADANGYVHYPDINLSEEMTDMMVGQRGYEINLSSINTIKDIYKQTIEMGK